jgi:hypothetical protein
VRIAAADVLDSVHPVGGLGERFGRRKLVEFLVVALLEVNDVPLAGAGYLDHREAVRRGVCQCDQAVEEARRGYRQAHTRLLRQESGRGRRVTGIAFVTEADVADARRLRNARNVGDRDADNAVDGPDVVELEGVDDQVVSRCRPADRRWLSTSAAAAQPALNVWDRTSMAVSVVLALLRSITPNPLAPNIFRRG